MKRDMDLVRNLLLAIEEKGRTPLEWIDDLVIEGRSDEEVAYHLWLLHQAGLIEATDVSSYSGFAYKAKCLSWAGTEFLDSIRDPEVWRRTKEAGAKVGGAGLELLWEIAKGMARQVVGEKLGIPLS